MTLTKTTAKLLIGDPLLSDQRLSKVAGRLVVEFPRLLDWETDFATWVEEPVEYEKDGLVGKLPRRAVLAMVSPNPKHEDNQMLTKAGMWYDHWKEEDRSFQRMNEKVDPALKMFRILAKEHIRVMENLEQLVD